MYFNLKYLNMYHILLCVCWIWVCVNCNWTENKGLWYYISPSDELVNYHGAIATCTSMNSRLVVITQDKQNEYISKNIIDGAPRWIGLSNKKPQNLAESDCGGLDYFWNTDRYCWNSYEKYEKGYDPPETSNCVGVIIKSNGRWQADNCKSTFGYVCQWECKRLYIHFQTLDQYSGVYLLDFYWHEHIAYVKANTDNYIEIYKDVHGHKPWVLGFEQDGEYPVVATFRSDSYVPYGEPIEWETQDNEDIKVGSFCIDCDRLSLYIKTYNNEHIYNDEMLLAWDILPYPTYAGDKLSVTITYNEDIFTYCIEIQGGDIKEDVCDYIFPYPDKTVIIKTDDRYIAYMNNMCIPTHDNTPTTGTVSISTKSLLSTSSSTMTQKQTVFLPTEELAPVHGKTSERQTSNPDSTSVTSVFTTDTSGLPAELEDSRDDKTVVIAVTVAVLLITVIIVTVVVSVFIVRHKRHKSPQKDKFQNKGITNHDAKVNQNIYLELDRSTSTKDNKNTQGSDSRDKLYSYADIPGRNPYPFVDDDSITDTQQAVNSRPAPVQGYLAPNYGVLNDNSISQMDTVDKNDKSEVVHAVYSEATAPNVSTTTSNTKHNISINPQNAQHTIECNSDDDLELHENDVYVDTFDTNQSSDAHENNVCYNESNGIRKEDTNIHITPPPEECDYYNVGNSTVDGDDLELFENSLYEETQ